MNLINKTSATGPDAFSQGKAVKPRQNTDQAPVPDAPDALKLRPEQRVDRAVPKPDEVCFEQPDSTKPPSPKASDPKATGTKATGPEMRGSDSHVTDEPVAKETARETKRTIRRSVECH